MAQEIRIPKLGLTMTEATLVNWLAGEEHLITLQPRSAKDSNLTLSSLHLNIVGIGFLIFVPLLLAGVGGYIWWTRRRA
jgi:hypothetical protein